MSHTRSPKPEVPFTISCMVADGRSRRLSCARDSIEISALCVRGCIRVVHIKVSTWRHVLPIVSIVSVVQERRPFAALCIPPILGCGRRDGVLAQWRDDLFLLRGYVLVSELGGVEDRYRALRGRTRIATLTNNSGAWTTTSPAIDNTTARAGPLTAVDHA